MARATSLVRGIIRAEKTGPINPHVAVFRFVQLSRSQISELPVTNYANFQTLEGH
jgi:hypothetical protein